MEKFAFVIHPLDTDDVARKFPFARRLPQLLVERALAKVPAFTVSEITGIKSPTGAAASGWFVSCPITSRLMMSLPEGGVLAKITESARLAERLGAGIVGLGALTSVVGDAGISVAKKVSIPVTTGNSYTVATAIQGLRYAANLFELDLTQATAAIVGASGSIGKTCARILADEVRELYLVGRRLEALTGLAQQISEQSKAEVFPTVDIRSALAKADVVLTVTSAVDTVIQPGDLRPGAIVCDVARPRDVSRQVAEARRDVLVFEGGVVKIPGQINFGFDFGFPAGTSYACMAETMILALERRYESFSLGRDLSVKQIAEISSLAEKHGFTLAGLRSFERALDEGEIMAIKNRITRRKGVVIPLEISRGESRINLA